MPFLMSQIEPLKKTQFYVFRAISPQLGMSFVVQKMAKSFHKQNKKVLVFDALLGLNNIHLTNKNQDKIPLIFDGTLPLNELIIHEQGIDFITGVSNQNLTSLSIHQQQSIKENLRQLSRNYDIVLIDMPYQVVSPILADMGENMWVVSADKEIICNTLANIPQNPHLVLNLKEDSPNLNQIYAFIKILSPTCQITII